MPKVSVIIPNYNHARFLPRRIESVLNQTYKDFEVIFLDDASTDNSLEVLEQYKEDMRIRVYLNTTNSGSPFKQWNKGVRLAKGEYVWIAESDDYAEHNFLQELIKPLDQDIATGIAFCKSYKIDKYGKVLAEWEQWIADGQDRRWQSYWISDGNIECRKQLFLGGTTLPNASAVLFRRSLFEHGGYAPEDMKLSGDWMLWAKMLLTCKLAFIPLSLNYFRSHAHTCRTSTFTNGIKNLEDYRVVAYLLNHLETDGELRSHILKVLAKRWANTVVSKNGHIPYTRNLQIWRTAQSIDPHIFKRVVSNILARPFLSLKRRFSSHGHL